MICKVFKDEDGDTVQVDNDCGHVWVEACFAEGDGRACVMLTPAQAREMAKTLLAAADELEGAQS